MKKLLLILALVLSVAVSAAPDAYRFSHIRAGRGSSNLEINNIFRDSDGFVWFGTSTGLLRYSGREITPAVSSDISSPLDDFVSTIQEDISGRLWVKVNDERYVLYDRRTKRCTEHVAEEMLRLTGREITPRDLYIDDDYNFWIYDGARIYFSHAASGECCDVAGCAGADYTELSAIVRCGRDCYMLYSSGAVAVVDAVSLMTKKQIPPPDKRNDDSGFGYIYVDSHHHVWITDNYSGLWRYDAQQGAWKHFGEQSAPRLSSNSVHAVLEDGEGNVWIATDHGGIDIYDCATGGMTALSHDAYDHTTIASNSVYSLYRDNEDNIWVGYYKRGVSLYSRARQKYFIHHIKGVLNRNLRDDISTICEDHAGNLWFGTDEFGLVRRDHASGEETFFRAGTHSMASNVIVRLFCDSQGRVWVGTYQGGMNCYENGRMTHFAHRDGDPNSLANDSVWAIDEDCDGNIWIGTLGGGVQRYNPRTGRFETLTASGSDLSSDFVLDMWCHRGEQLYISTVNCVESMDVRTLRHTALFGEGDIKMMNIYRDSRGLLWAVGRLGEVMIYDTKESHMIVPPRELAGKNVRSVIEDDNKNIWLATDHGLYNVIVASNPRTAEHSFSTCCYKRHDDDVSEDWSYNVRAVARTRSGDIIFGSTNGYTVINPNSDDLNVAPDRDRVMFTALRINNTEVLVDSLYDGAVILSRGIEFTDRIDLHYRQNRFSLEFASLDYSSALRTEYFYQMQGFSSEWLPVTGERNDVTFTNLSPGEYRMRICALRTDGSLGDDVAALSIVVHPPFWRTTLARLLYFLLFMAFVGGFLAIVFRRQRRKLEFQRAEMEIERQNQLNEMKIRFFTNISHDFRTPLSLIITPIEELRNRCAEEMRPSLDIIQRNAQRLLQLVNQLLDFRKLDVYGATLDLSHGDFVMFVRDICSSFELLSENANITLSVDSSVETLEMTFDKDKMSKVFMNLLSNAFKYTPGDGRVTVSIELVPDHDAGRMVAVAVSDTGIGIPDADKQHIFERFYQVERASVRDGSGIGLHIAREFIALHGGSISLRDNTPQGSVFYFVMPVAEGHATHDEEGRDTDAVESPNAGQGRSAVLLVEDNDEFRRFMRDSLSPDHDIFEAADGVEALEVLRDNSVDIIISDIMMPRMDGLELCRRVKGDIATSHIPLILLTARAMQEHELEGLAVGADDYVTKPFNLSILRLRISKLMEWHKRSHELFRKTAEIKPSDITITSLDEKLIENALRIVERNMDNSEFSVEDLSTELGMHRTHLYKKLTFITGKSPLEFIRIVRLKRAAQLLEQSRMNISEVAYMVGFNSPKIFTKYFREEFGTSPREYLRQSTGRSDAHSEE